MAESLPDRNDFMCRCGWRESDHDDSFDHRPEPANYTPDRPIPHSGNRKERDCGYITGKCPLPLGHAGHHWHAVWEGHDRVVRDTPCWPHVRFAYFLGFGLGLIVGFAVGWML